MEVIDWVEHEEKDPWNRTNLVSWALLEAMAEKQEQIGINIEELFAPFEPQALNVEFKVNGVSLSFVSVMEKIQSHVEGIEEDCRKTMIKDAAKDIIEHLQDQYRTYEE
nr:MAG TPA: hypothetical protein [Caudoviricetes sp.]